MSRLPFELFLALRYLRPKRTFVSVITLISIVGVMLGVAVLIIVISVMSGFDRELRDRILGFNAHLKIHKPRVPMDEYALLRHVISSNQAVKGVAPYVVGPVLVETQPSDGSPQVFTPFIRGVDPKLEGKVSMLTNSIVDGEFDLRANGLVIGREFSHMLGIGLGDVLAVYSVGNLRKMKQAREEKEEIAILPEDFEVRGIFDVGYYDFNASVIICSLANAQHLYDLEDGVHGLIVMLHDPDQADLVKHQLRAAIGPNYYISTWAEDNSAILNALVVEKNVMFYLLFFIMIVAAFGITSALITFVVQKTREIGMLKALGATRGQIMFLFLSQSLIVGLLGVLSGFGLGMIALEYRNDFLAIMNRLTGFELFPAAIYHFTELPALLRAGDIGAICGGSLLICLLAGLLPAWNAGRLQPVEALRHE